MQARSEETRAHILEAALRRFANHGYSAASWMRFAPMQV